MIFLWIVFALLAFAVAVFALLLFSPVVAEVETRSRQVRIGWSFLLAYTRPLPGSEGQPQLAIAGVSIRIPRGQRGTGKKKKAKHAAERIQARSRRRQKRARFLWECLLEPDIRTALTRRFAHLPVDLWEAVEVSRWHSNVSLPDPALNGMLWGALAAAGPGTRTSFECNFIGRNELQTEVRLYPNRVAKAFLRFFLRLPYRAIYKQWRSS
jgi:hypothetical protein